MVVKGQAGMGEVVMPDSALVLTLGGVWVAISGTRDQTLVGSMQCKCLNPCIRFQNWGGGEVFFIS